MIFGPSVAFWRGKGLPRTRSAACSCRRVLDSRPLGHTRWHTPPALWLRCLPVGPHEVGVASTLTLEWSRSTNSSVAEFWLRRQFSRECGPSMRQICMAVPERSDVACPCSPCACSHAAVGLPLQRWAACGKAPSAPRKAPCVVDEHDGVLL